MQRHSSFTDIVRDLRLIGIEARDDCVREEVVGRWKRLDFAFARVEGVAGGTAEGGPAGEDQGGAEERGHVGGGRW